MALALTALSGSLAAQFGESAPAGSSQESASRTGFEIYSVSMFTSRSVTTLPADAAGSPSARYRDLLTGIAGGVGWKLRSRGSSTSFYYSGSYATRPADARLSSDAHAFGFRHDRGLGGRLKWTISAEGTLFDSQELLFTPAAFTTIGPTTDSLSGGRLSSRIAPLSTGAPTVTSQAQTLAFGSRVFNSSLQSGWSFSSSPLTSYSISIGLNRFDNLSGSSSSADLGKAVAPGGLPGTVGILNSFSTAAIRASVTHTLNERTATGIDVNEERTLARGQDAYINTASVFVDRTLTPTLIAHVSVGGGYVKPVRATPDIVDRPTVTSEGSLSWRVYEQALGISATRTLADWIGRGANVFTSYTASWAWSRPRGSWMFQTWASLEQTADRRYGKLNGWSANVSGTRQIGPYTRISMQYSRISLSLPQAIASEIAQTRLDGVRASLIFVPRRGAMY